MLLAQRVGGPQLAQHSPKALRIPKEQKEMKKQSILQDSLFSRSKEQHVRLLCKPVCLSVPPHPNMICRQLTQFYVTFDFCFQFPPPRFCFHLLHFLPFLDISCHFLGRVPRSQAGLTGSCLHHHCHGGPPPPTTTLHWLTPTTTTTTLWHYTVTRTVMDGRGTLPLRWRSVYTCLFRSKFVHSLATKYSLLVLHPDVDAARCNTKLPSILVCHRSEPQILALNTVRGASGEINRMSFISCLKKRTRQIWHQFGARRHHLSGSLTTKSSRSSIVPQQNTFRLFRAKENIGHNVANNFHWHASEKPEVSTVDAVVLVEVYACRRVRVVLVPLG